MSVYRIRCETVFPNIVETEIVVREGRQRNLLSFGPSTVSSSRWLIRVGRQRCVDDQVRVVEAGRPSARPTSTFSRGEDGASRVTNTRENTTGEGEGQKKRRVGADVGSRTDEAGAGGGHTTGEGGWCVYPSRRGWRRTCARISRVRPTHIDPTPANSLVLAGGGRRGV